MRPGKQKKKPLFFQEGKKIRQEGGRAQTGSRTGPNHPKLRERWAPPSFL